VVPLACRVRSVLCPAVRLAPAKVAVRPAGTPLTDKVSRLVTSPLPVRRTCTAACPAAGTGRLAGRALSWTSWVGSTTKAPEDVAVPAVVWTLRGPVLAPAGTTAVRRVGLATVTPPAATPLKLTPRTLAKLLPVSVTAVPTDPEVGANVVRVGGGRITVTVVLAVKPSGWVAVRVVVPGVSAVARPRGEMPATLGALLVQVTTVVRS
jgi:hypothetical protein